MWLLVKPLLADTLCTACPGPARCDSLLHLGRYGSEHHLEDGPLAHAALLAAPPRSQAQPAPALHGRVELQAGDQGPALAARAHTAPGALGGVAVGGPAPTDISELALRAVGAAEAGLWRAWPSHGTELTSMQQQHQQ